MFLTILAFLIVLGVLVMVHEFGHFLAAKKLGVKVEEFAFGFPPRIFSFKKGETRYSFNAIPFGGYVKMLGELEHSSSPRAFENQSPWKRFTIAIAGVMMNLVLAWIILAIGFSFGMTPLVSDPNIIPGKKLSSKIIIASVQKDSQAERASFSSGDILLSAVAGGSKTEFDSVDSVGNFTRAHLNQEVAFQYKRESETAEKKVKLSENQEMPLGVALIESAVVKVPWYRAPYVALYETWQVVRITFSFLANLLRDLFTAGKVSEGVGGPVAVYVYSGLAVRLGFMAFLQFIAMLSVNLALINILPFPALDGGRLLFILFEKVLGRKIVAEEIENIIHSIGFIILIALLIAVTYRDIIKLF